MHRVWLLLATMLLQAQCHAAFPFFSTKTSYAHSTFSNGSSLPEPSISILKGHHHHQCTLVQLNYVVRHGTRYPSKKDILAIRALGEILKNLTWAKPAWLNETWQCPYVLTKASTLVETTGVQEMIELGARLRTHVQSSSGSRYSHFETTNRTRTHASALAFAFGFFNRTFRPIQVHVVPEVHPLRFFDHCPHYVHAIKNNRSSSLRGYHEFIHESPMRKGLRDFQRQFPPHANVSMSDFISVHTACAFEMAISQSRDGWCSLLTHEMLVLLDEYKDRKAYYSKSAGDPTKFSWEMSAPLLQHMYESMWFQMQMHHHHHYHSRDRSSSEDEILAFKTRHMFRFAHAETLLPLISLLQFPHDSDHRRQPFHRLRRSFRAAQIVPFGANVGFHLYHCHNVVGLSSTGYRIQVRLNERPMDIQGCQNKHLCSIEEWERKFGRYLFHWNGEKECRIRGM